MRRMPVVDPHLPPDSFSQSREFNFLAAHLSSAGIVNRQENAGIKLAAKPALRDHSRDRQPKLPATEEQLLLKFQDERLFELPKRGGEFCMCPTIDDSFHKSGQM